MNINYDKKINNSIFPIKFSENNNSFCCIHEIEKYNNYDLIIYDSKSYYEIKRIEGKGLLNHLIYLNSELIIGCFFQSLIFIDLNTNKTIKKISFQPKDEICISYNSNDKNLLIGSNNELILYNIDNFIQIDSILFNNSEEMIKLLYLKETKVVIIYKISYFYYFKIYDFYTKETIYNSKNSNISFGDKIIDIVISENKDTIFVGYVNTIESYSPSIIIGYDTNSWKIIYKMLNTYSINLYSFCLNNKYIFSLEENTKYSYYDSNKTNNCLNRYKLSLNVWEIEPQKIINVYDNIPLNTEKVSYNQITKDILISSIIENNETFIDVYNLKQ